MGISINAGTPPAIPVGDASSADDLLPLKTRGFPSPDSQPFGQTVAERAECAAQKLPGFLPPRPQNGGSDTPFNSATGIFETTTVKAGDVNLTARYNDGGLLTQPPDRGTPFIAPAGRRANVDRVDVTLPLIRDQAITFNVKAGIDSGQNLRVGSELTATLGDVKFNASFYEKQPLQSVGQDDAKARNELNIGGSVKLSNEVTVGVAVTQNTGGTARQNGTTRLELPVTLNLGGANGTQVQLIPTVTINNKTGDSTQLGGAITVQPIKPDNTKPYGFGAVKIGDNPLTDDSASFSITGGVRF